MTSMYYGGSALAKLQRAERERKSQRRRPRRVNQTKVDIPHSRQARQLILHLEANDAAYDEDIARDLNGDKRNVILALQRLVGRQLITRTIEYPSVRYRSSLTAKGRSVAEQLASLGPGAGASHAPVMLEQSYQALAFVEANEIITCYDLAEHLSITPARASSRLKQLLDQGYLERAGRVLANRHNVVQWRRSEKPIIKPTE